MNDSSESQTDPSTDLFVYTNYRVYLKALLQQKQQHHSAFSMRAFAKQLGLSQTSLSLVLSGKKNFSANMAVQIASRLRLDRTETEYFCTLVQCETARKPETKRALMEKLAGIHPAKQRTQLSPEDFEAISDWYYLPILSMVDVDDADFSPETLARRLGIMSGEARAALERLCSLELLEAYQSKGWKTARRYRRKKTFFVARSETVNEALRKFHHQMLHKATQALTEQTPEERFVGSETFAFSKERLREAESLAEEFFQKMRALSDHTPKKDTVYHLGVQFFDVLDGRRSR